MKFLELVVNKYVYRRWLAARLASVGRNFRLGYRSELLNPQYFSVGNDFFSGPYCYFVTNVFARVSIGNSVMMGPYCKVIGGNHDFTYTMGHLRECSIPRAMEEPIVIEDGVWIGADSLILSGAHIGEGAVIGAKAVVNHRIPPYVIAVGVPAKRFRARFESTEALGEILRNVRSHYTVEEVHRLHASCGMAS